MMKADGLREVELGDLLEAEFKKDPRRLGVSEVTVRRDLDVLAQSGLIEKVHGGAMTRSRLSADEPSFESKSHRQVAEKEAIARVASELVEPGQAVALSAGTTTWRRARRLRRTPNLTVITNSLSVAKALIRSAEKLVVLADHTKWGVRGLVSIAGLGDADLLITDDGVPADAYSILSDSIAEIVLAPARSRRATAAPASRR